MDQRTLFRLAFIPALLALSLTVFAVPRFAELYEANDSALSAFTQFWLDWYALLAPLPIVVLLVPWRLAPCSPRRGARTHPRHGCQYRRRGARGVGLLLFSLLPCMVLRQHLLCVQADR